MCRTGIFRIRRLSRRASFLNFSASQILKDYDLSDEEIENGIVGSGNDGGCDGIYIFLNKNLIMSDQVGIGIKSL